MRSPRKERQDINVPGSKGKGINPKEKREIEAREILTNGQR